MTSQANEPLFSAEAWRELRALLDTLDPLSAADRTAELARVAVTDPALAEKARALLEPLTAGEGSGLHDAWRRAFPAAEIAMPERIGPFRPLRRIGSGGMGVVFLAQRADADFTQQVALKLLDGDAARMARVAARERRILAALTHPNITAFVDAGVQDGHAWLAMEYIDGEPLLAYCARHRLGVRERVELFDQVCAAVGYAHAQLVVHRDLKPSNVLVNADGAVKLLDFGIALVLDASDEHAPATRVFTPEYAAPEQLRGERVTTATDVYALGLLLYETVTGARLPTLERGDAGMEWTTAELARRATSTRPQAQAAVASDPRTLTRSLRGDLGRIIAHALNPDPTQRYASVQQMREDLRRWVGFRPIGIARPGWRYVAARFVRRHRVGVAVGTLLALTLFGAVGAVLWEAREATHEASRAIAVKSFLTGLFDDTRNTRAGMQVRTASAMDILNNGADRLKTELGDQPEVRDEIYTMLVEIFDSSGDGARSEALARSRLAAAEAAYGADDARVASATTMLAGVLINHQKIDAAKPLLARSQILLDRAADNESLERARLLTWQGNVQRLEGGKEAKFEGNALIKAVDLLRSRYPKEDDFDVALFMFSNLAVTSGHFAEAEKASAEMHDSAAARYGQNTVYVTQADLLRARILLKENKFDEAAMLSKDVVNGFVKFEGAEHPDVLYAEFVELNALVNLQRMDDARTLFAKADAVRREKFADDPRLKRGFAELAAKLGLADPIEP